MLSEGAVDPSKAKEAVEASIALLGNASAHFSVECRKSLMKHMNKDLRPLCEGKFPKCGPHLFGEDFGSKAKKTANNIRALKGVSMGRDRFSQFGSSNKGKQPQSHQFTWARVHKPHRARCSTVSVPRSRTKTPNFRSPIRTRRSKKYTTSFTTYNRTEVGSNMPMGTVHHPTSWFTTFAFSLLQYLDLTTPLPPSPQLAGRTVLHLENWAKITDSQWVLEAVAGYKLELEKIPFQSHHPVMVAQKEPGRAYSPGGANPSRQGSYCRSPSSSRERWVLLNTVISAKERANTGQ